VRTVKGRATCRWIWTDGFLGVGLLGLQLCEERDEGAVGQERVERTRWTGGWFDLLNDVSHGPRHVRGNADHRWLHLFRPAVSVAERILSGLSSSAWRSVRALEPQGDGARRVSLGCGMSLGVSGWCHGSLRPATGKYPRRRASG